MPNIQHTLVDGIWSEGRSQRKARSVDALRKCEAAVADLLVICTVQVEVARLYWANRKIEKAHEWFKRAVSEGPDLVDAWGCGSNSNANMGQRRNRRM